MSGLLAVALRRCGHKVGLLDADVTGPSLPKMFFPTPVRVVPGDEGLIPARSRTGILVMSMNLLLDDETQAVIWRGPLIAGAIQQFWNQVMWGELDYLIADLPPGTSDAALTVLQSLPMSGVVLVTAPQSLAGMVVCKAAQLARALDIPVLGLIENLSYYPCPQTGTRHLIFGPGNAGVLAEKLETSLLGSLPIDPELARLCDSGLIEDYAAAEFAPLADKIAAAAPLAQPPKMPLHSSTEVERLSPTVRRLSATPENMGRLEQPDAWGLVRGSCGDTMHIDLNLQDGRICQALFLTDGCGITRACAV